MNQVFKFRTLLTVLGLSILFAWNGCKPDDPLPDPPEDNDPTITVISPSTNYSLNFRGNVVTVNFRLDDPEQLNAFWVDETWTSVDGTVYINDNAPYILEKTISGNTVIEEVNYTVPTTQIQTYSTITLTAYVQDNRGKVSSATFVINVLPEPGSTPFYEIQEYSDRLDTIYSVLTGSNYNFSFLHRTNDPSSSALYDITESSISPNFTGILTAGNQPGTDSVIVMTSPSAFNYDDLDYQTTWEAFITSNQIGAESAPLAAGDIVIIKMVTLPHYAIMNIVEVNKVDGYITFNYKYSKTP